MISATIASPPMTAKMIDHVLTTLSTTHAAGPGIEVGATDIFQCVSLSTMTVVVVVEYGFAVARVSSMH